MTVNLTVTAAPEVGDVLIQSGTVNRISGVTSLGSNTYNLTLKAQASFVVGGSPSPILYKNYTTTIKTSPFHAGAIGRSKQFAQLQLHMRDMSIRDMNITFGGQSYGSSPSVDWESTDTQSNLGWGLAQWGLFAWGLSDTTAITYKTETAPIIRVYVPLIAQRSTFIQPILTHKNAAEEINLQAITYAVRGYGERVSR